MVVVYKAYTSIKLLVVSMVGLFCWQSVPFSFRFRFSYNFISVFSDLSHAELPANGIVQFLAFFAEFGAEEAIDEDVGRGVHRQQDVAEADSDLWPQGKWILSGILTLHCMPRLMWKMMIMMRDELKAVKTQQRTWWWPARECWGTDGENGRSERPEWSPWKWQPCYLPSYT